LGDRVFPGSRLMRICRNTLGAILIAILFTTCKMQLIRHSGGGGGENFMWIWFSLNAQAT